MDDTGNYKPFINKDTDTTVFDEELLILAGLYKWKQEMGYEYAEAMRDYQLRLDKAKNDDIIKPVIRAVAHADAKAGLNLPESIPAGDN
jgi:hypothetical protein